MELCEAKKFLIISGTEKGHEGLKTLLAEIGYSNVTCAESSQSAAELIDNTGYDIIIINSPLTDGSGRALAYSASEAGNAVIFIVKNDFYEKISSEAEKKGVLVLGRPIKKSELHRSIKLMFVMNSRLKRFQAENQKLQTKLEEIKVVSRAKGILMQYLGMSEEQAHKYIERQAMDMRTSKEKVSLGILKTYEQ